MRCNYCKKYFSVVNVDYPLYEIYKNFDALVCESCSLEHFFICYGCDQIYKIEKSTKIDGSLYCEECRDSLFTWCWQCEEYTYNEDIVYLEHYDRYICRNCLTDYYRCDFCDNYFESCDIQYCDNCDQYYCEDCANYHNCCANNELHCYSYKPDPVFYGSGFFYGVELEIESEDRFLLVENWNFQEIYLKEDGSLDDYKGVELVSHPCSPDYHKTLWKNILKFLKKYDCDSHDNGRCGLHIHIDKRNFGKDTKVRELNLIKFSYFFYQNFEFFRKFSRRSSSQLDRWAKQYILKKKNPKKEFNLMLDQNIDDCRYFALNFRNKNTVECRLFRGTLKYESLISCIEIIDALIKFTKQKSIIQILNKNGQLFSEFIEYIKKNYEILPKYLKERELI